jgi:type I restriction enzyme S subunit
VTWKTAALGSLCDVKTGKKDVNEGNENGVYPFFTCALKHTYSDNFSFDCEAILIAGNGAVGQTSYYKGKFEAYQRTYVLSNFKGVLPQYLLYVLNGRLMKELSSKVLGNTIPYIKKGMLTEFEVPLPPLSTQQKIVAKLDAIFAEIDKATVAAEANAKNAEALFQSDLKQIFQNIDQDWRVAELASVCDVFADGDWIETKDQSETGIRLIQTGNIGFGKFKARDSKARYVSEETFKRLRCTEIQQGDILVSRLPDPVGRACVIPKLDVKSITAVDCTIIRSNKEVISAEFLNFVFQSPQYFEQVKLNITGATRQRISRSLLAKTQIPIPPLVTQDNIVSRLIVISNELEKSSKSYKEKVSELAALKHSILRQAFSGELIKE